MATKTSSKKGGKGTTKNREAGDEKTTAPASGSSVESIGPKRLARSPIIVTGGVKGCTVEVRLGGYLQDLADTTRRFSRAEHGNSDLRVNSVIIIAAGADVEQSGGVTTITPREGNVEVQFEYADPLP